VFTGRYGDARLRETAAGGERRMPEPDPELAITADEARQLLNAAARDLAAARQKLDARPRGDRGTVAEEAALTIAMAQATALLAIAGHLMDDDGLGRPLRKIEAGVVEAVREIGGLSARLRNPR
jgi:hypothetical protein